MLKYWILDFMLLQRPSFDRLGNTDLALTKAAIPAGDAPGNREPHEGVRIKEAGT